MNIIESFRMATATLVANKMRSSLTMLGIVIGNASVIAMVGIGEGAKNLASEQFESLGPNVIFVGAGTQEERRTTFNTPQTLVWEDAIAIKEQVPSIRDVAPQIAANQLITYRNRNASEQIIGTTPEYLTVRSFEVDKGRFFSSIDVKRNRRVVVLGAEIADKFFPQQDPLGKKIRVKNINLEIIGVLKAKGAFLGQNQDLTVYVPLTTMANQIVGNTSPYGTQVTIISIAAKDEDSIRAAKLQIENLLRLRHKITGKDDFSVSTQKDVLQIVGTITSGLTVLLAAIAGISLLVGGIGVMNIMLVAVSERTKEIGLRKAIGAKEGDILWQFLIEATILSAAGGAVGTVVGVTGIIIVGALSPLAPTISPVAIVLAVGVSGAIGLSFGVFPAKAAAKLDPIVALRSI
ncbi:ABC transporter permease [Waterburya agarophytonicola K14]|uniref:ABC transporter permease n=1 Tax=Waterburya agarophytonicola KI4 TaxID=2874699 RepID=A0A964BMS4_9CYAN|nr:ABC transporter permease [Waterburya agarophytonicola]MCC0176329.1 ABC transporter permease [Waterburya agarophytonicola KI4]